MMPFFLLDILLGSEEEMKQLPTEDVPALENLIMEVKTETKEVHIFRSFFLINIARRGKQAFLEKKTLGIGVERKIQFF